MALERGRVKRVGKDGRTHNVGDYVRVVARVIDGRPSIVNGYVRIYCPFHPAAMHDGYVYEHRLVAERSAGRFVESGEFVRRRNRNRGDNRPENLYITRPAPPTIYAGYGKGWRLGLRAKEAHEHWKGDAASAEAKRERARRWYPITEPCERCGSEKNLEHHHVDGDPGNNRRSNVQILCRRCHMIVDGRSAASAERGRRMADAARQ